MQLYFETYLIAALLFVVITLLVRRWFFKSKGYTIGSGLLFVFLGFTVPTFLIIMQNYNGSLGHISWLEMENWYFHEGFTYEEMIQHIRNIYDTHKSNLQISLETYGHHLGWMFLSIAAGIITGIVLFQFVRRRKDSNHLS
jgi:hypothetical protein